MHWIQSNFDDPLMSQVALGIASNLGAVNIAVLVLGPGLYSGGQGKDGHYVQKIRDGRIGKGLRLLWISTFLYLISVLIGLLSLILERWYLTLAQYLALSAGVVITILGLLVIGQFLFGED